MNNNNGNFWLWVAMLVAFIGVGVCGYVYYQYEQKRELLRTMRSQIIRTAAVTTVTEPILAPAPITFAIDKSLPLISFGMLEDATSDDLQRPVFGEEIRQHDGQQVRMRGFMSPYDDIRDMRTFMLFSYPVGCNFCTPPAVNQVVLVQQKVGQRNYHFIDDPIEISGILHVWQDNSNIPEFDDVTFLYLLDEADVVVWKLDEKAIDELHR